MIFLISWTVRPFFSQTVFDPKKDGWYFENWGEKGDYCIGSCDFSWDLFRRTYLGIYPNNDAGAAPLDVTFYEIFKNCASQGNCGGMSVLALALFKYGGYLGFCSPASFYTGTKSPDREDLHRALNIIQARQFSYSGISRYIQAVDHDNLEDPDAAFSNVEVELGKGDYPVLWISTDSFGDAAHTVIPYKIEQKGVQKIMYIWDSNFPYDDNPTRYDSNTDNKLTISPPVGNWSYTSGANHYGPGGWCLCVPMSDILKKSRNPFALDTISRALRTLFVGGPGAAVSQVTNGEGKHLYKLEKDVQLSWADLERDPAKRIQGLVRWPWLGNMAHGSLPGELYFMSIRPGQKSDLEVTISGTQYKAVFHQQGNLIEITADSTTRSKDTIRFSNISMPNQTLEISTLAPQKRMTIRQLRTDIRRKNYRQFEIKNMTLESRAATNIRIIGDLEGIEVSSSQQAVSFQLNIIQRRNRVVASRQLTGLTTELGKVLCIAPRNWAKLGRTELEQKFYKKKKLKK